MCNIRMAAEQAGYEVKLPERDPHGRKWWGIEDGDLADMGSWAMLPAYHEALRQEFSRRKALDPFSRAIEDAARRGHNAEQNVYGHQRGVFA